VIAAAFRKKRGQAASQRRRDLRNLPSPNGLCV